MNQPSSISIKRRPLALLGLAVCSLVSLADAAPRAQAIAPSSPVPLADPEAKGAPHATFAEFQSFCTFPLVLNPTRIATWQMPPNALQESGIEFAAVRPWPIAGWEIIELPATDGRSSTPLNDPGNPEGNLLASIRERVTRLAQHQPNRFAAPVFVGLDGGPLIPTPVLLLSFDAAHRGASARQTLAAFPELEVLAEDWANMPGSYKVRVHSADGFRVLAIAAQLFAKEGVEYVEPDWILTGHGSEISNDPLLGDQWGLSNTGQSGGTPDMDINATEAWDITKGNSALKVLVIDTGVEQTHPDINQLPGVDLTSEGPGTGDPVNQWDNHGTPVAGCISAIIDNSLGVVGSAPHCPAVSARSFISINSSGSWTGQPSWTVDALTYAESIGVRVTNNSNTYGAPSTAISSKYAATQDTGMVHFASAGNGGSSFVDFPASLSSVAAIGSINRNGNLAASSNHGVFLTFTAPGVQVVSTDRSGAAGYSLGRFTTVSGTSFASPYCAGVAALMLALDPSLDGPQMTTLLRQNVKDLGTPGFDDTFGWGLVDAFAAALDATPNKGGLHSWASDASGQVSGTANGADFIGVACGQDHSIALRMDSSIVAWGADGAGQVSGAPTGLGFIQVSAGANHSLALLADGSILAWGADSSMQVANTPAAFHHTQVAAGANHSLALANDGTISSWGRDVEGQVSGTPIGNDFIQVAAGSNHSLALRDDGSIASWGLDNHGQVTNAPAGTGFVQIAAGNGHALALHGDGSIVSWGFDGNFAVSNTPSSMGFVQIAAGEFHSLAVAADGSITSWGLDSFGTVSGIPGGTGFVQVAAGHQHGLAIFFQDPGNAYCFGDGSGSACPCSADGQVGEGCANSGGVGGAQLVGLGSARLSIDTFRLAVSGVPGNKPGLVLRGANAVNSGLGNPLGDGLLCVGSNTARSQVQVTSAGSTTFSNFQGGPFGATSYGVGVPTNYQFWYRDAGNTCSGSGFNFSNAWAVTYAL